MSKPSKDFFVSYQHSDAAWAEWIAWHVENAGYKTIVQSWDFEPGMNFVDMMDRALRDCRRLLAVLSPSYMRSRYVKSEWMEFYRLDPVGHHRSVVPVRVKKCNVRGLLGPIVYIDLVGLSEDEAARALLRGLQSNRRPHDPPRWPGRPQSPLPTGPDSSGGGGGPTLGGFQFAIITLDSSIAAFPPRTLNALQEAIADYLGRECDAVEVLTIGEGSVIVILQVIADDAERLSSAFALGDTELLNDLGAFPIRKMEWGMMAPSHDSADLTRHEAAQESPAFESAWTDGPADSPGHAFPYRWLPKRQRLILDFIEHHVMEHGYPPTLREIGRALGISSTAPIVRDIDRLVSKGLVERSRQVARGLKLMNVPVADSPRQALRPTVRIPLVPSRIAAGSPIQIPDGVDLATCEEWLDLPADMILTRGDVYAVRVTGSSMIDALIGEGDVVVMELTDNVQNGDMVAAWIKDRWETTLKEFYHEGSRVRLQPRNPTMMPIFVDPDDVEIQGRVILVIRGWRG